jgi:hypothetical protein
MRFAARIIFCALVFVAIYYTYNGIVFWPRDLLMRAVVSFLLAGAAVVLAWRISASQGVLSFYCCTYRKAAKQ